MTRVITRSELRRPGLLATGMLGAGLAIGFVGGQLAPDIAGSVSRRQPVQIQRAQVPSLAPTSDYGIRHLLVPVLTERDDFATRHGGAPALGPADDYATRH